MNDEVKTIIDGLLLATGNTARVTAVDQASSFVLDKNGKQTAVLWDGVQYTLSEPLRYPAALRQAIESRLPLDVRPDGNRLFLYTRYDATTTAHDLRAGRFVAPSPPIDYIFKSE